MTKAADVGKRIRARMLLLDYNTRRMAVKMHVSERTWQRKISRPENLTVAELLKLEKILDFKILQEVEK